MADITEIKRLYPDLEYPERYDLATNADGEQELVYKSVHDGPVIDAAISRIANGEIEADADRAEEAAKAAQAAREGVENFAEQAGKSAGEAAESAAAAQQSAKDVEAAKKNVADNATKAETAAKAADSSKTAAGKSEENAAGSASAADQHKKDAETAQTAAEAAKSAAEGLATAAEESASAAALSEESAAESAASADTSAKAAEAEANRATEVLESKAGFPKIGPASAAWDLDKGGILFITDDADIPTPTDLPTLLKAAQLANNGKPAALNGLTAISDLTDDARYLKKSFNGESFADVEVFKAAVREAVGAGGASMTWAQTQYAIIHGAAAPNAGVANTEANAYYWWRGGGTGSPVVLNTSDITTLLEAAYRAGENGNIHAWDNLTEDFLSVWESGFRIVKSSDSAMDFDSMTRYTMSAKSEFCTTLEALVAKAGGDYKTLTWYQIQDYIIVANGNYRPEGSINKDDYWWKLSKTNSGTPLTPREKFDKMLYDAVNLNAGDIKLTITWSLLNDFGFMQTSGVPYDATTNIAAVQTRISVMASKFTEYLISASDGKQMLNLTWYQVEWYVLKNAVKAPADAQSLFEAAYAWGPPDGWEAIE